MSHSATFALSPVVVIRTSGIIHNRSAIANGRPPIAFAALTTAGADNFSLAGTPQNLGRLRHENDPIVGFGSPRLVGLGEQHGRAVLEPRQREGESPTADASQVSLRPTATHPPSAPTAPWGVRGSPPEPT